jgi:CheY-like chemotaxis protein/HPt (histidine-containing phosphotransfer) domain-containing protein
VELGVCWDTSERHSKLRFDVRDTGIGITQQQMTRLFQPFNQADDSTTRRFGGSGLGLTISQRLTRMLGGTIDARSEHGQGSTFSVIIDTGASPTDPAQIIEHPDESILGTSVKAPTQIGIRLSGRLLLAEDGRDNQRLISTHLRNAGAEVVIAENGRIAVDLATTQRFDLILMDMQMPEMDGYEATSELRRRGMALPIVALTAHAMADDRAKCLGAGCTDYLTKPIEKELLLATVRSYLLAGTARPGLRSEFADDKDMKDVLAEFIAGLPEQVREIERLLEERDANALKRAAHQLKGAGGGYGFPSITDAAARAERQIAEGQPLANVQKQIEELVELIRSVEGYHEPSTAVEAAVLS